MEFFLPGISGVRANDKDKRRESSPWEVLAVESLFNNMLPNFWTSFEGPVHDHATPDFYMCGIG